MLITFLDDSIPFDGRSPAKQAMGGAEKALVALSTALSRRGHTVRVFNRCLSAVVVEGVSWQPIETCEAAYSDWLIAHRKPTLLSHVPRAKKVALWLGGHAGYLANSVPSKAMNTRKPILLLQTLSQSSTVPHSLQVKSAEILPPATLDYYRLSGGMVLSCPKRVIVTTHPRNGMRWLVRLWSEQISVQVPDAELHVYSSLLFRGSKTRLPDPALSEILQLVAQSYSSRVKIFAPVPDAQMAEVYTGARAHLYPGDPRDLLCPTLGDSQASGLPAVGRDLGGVGERLLNGKSGFLAKDDDVFKKRVIRLVNDDDFFMEASKVAKKEQSKRSWDDVASDLERIFS
tara:strand:+ start:149 stop:1180 length:1032 start_codon:yes stop_codon:yes gene_type:complete